MDSKTRRNILRNILLGETETIANVNRVIEDIMRNPLPGKSIPRNPELNKEHNNLSLCQTRINNCLAGDQTAMYIGIHGKYKMMCKQLKANSSQKFNFTSSFFRQSFQSYKKSKFFAYQLFTIHNILTTQVFVFPPLLIQSSQTGVLYSEYFLFFVYDTGPVIPICIKKVTPAMIKRLYNLQHHTTVTIPTLNYLLHTERLYLPVIPMKNYTTCPLNIFFV